MFLSKQKNKINISEFDHIGFNSKEQLFFWYNEYDE